MRVLLRGDTCWHHDAVPRDHLHVYPAGDMPDVEVRVDDQWVPGEARMRWRDSETGIWWYQVQWRPPGTTTRKIDRFPADRLRPASVGDGP